MKTAISIPDQLYRRAEQIARELDVSRSRLYTTALEEYLSRHEEVAVTQRINEVVADEIDRIDDGIVAAQARVIAGSSDESW